MKVSSYIAKFLKRKKIDLLFELQGGMITRILDACYHEKDFKIVSMHHEQSAAMAADAYGRITRRPGLALATSGPGATNLLTGVGNCYFDSVPAIFITGQVNINEQKNDRATRQIGFQETDIVSMARPITKKVYAVKAAREIPAVLAEAYQIALSGRPGPVLIDIPMNVQDEEIEIADDWEPHTHALAKEPDAAKNFLHDYLRAFQNSKRPLILVGRGVRAAGAVELFQEFIGKYQIPVVTSLLGLDVLPYQHAERIGFIGTYGNRWANFALGNSDLLLVLGSRLDLRQTGADIASFQKNKIIYHVDIDPAELNNRMSGCITLESDLAQFFLETRGVASSCQAPAEWIESIAREKQIRLDTDELGKVAGINPNVFIHKLSQASRAAKALVADVGNNQMWCAQSLELADDQLFLTSGGMGAMGYALPAAIGASITLGNAPVVAIAGDGGFQINIQELQTVVRNNLPVKIIIINNHCLGMIRQFQDSYFNSCYQSTVWGYSAPDFAEIALAYGIESYSISKADEMEMGLEKMWSDPAKPFLLDVTIDIHTNVYPKMMYGSPISKMEPELLS